MRSEFKHMRWYGWVMCIWGLLPAIYMIYRGIHPWLSSFDLFAAGGIFGFALRDWRAVIDASIVSTRHEIRRTSAEIDRLIERDLSYYRDRN